MKPWWQCSSFWLLAACWMDTTFAWTLPFHVTGNKPILPLAVSPPSTLYKITTSNPRSRRCCTSQRMMSSSTQQQQPKWWRNVDVHDLPYESALRALEAYHGVHGDLAIPPNYIVPDTNGETAFHWTRHTILYPCPLEVKWNLLSNLHLTFHPHHHVHKISMVHNNISKLRISSRMARGQTRPLHLQNEMVAKEHRPTPGSRPPAQQIRLHMGTPPTPMEHLHRGYGHLPQHASQCQRSR